MSFNPHLLPKVRSAALLESCSSMPCDLRISSLIPGHACSAQATVVPAHLPTIGKGVGTKVSDLFVVAACQHCHDILDMRDERWNYLADNCPAATMDRLLRGMAATQSRWLGMGLIVVPDGRIL